MNKFSRLLLCCALALANSAYAQTNIRVRGTITAFDGAVLSVKSLEGKETAIHIGEKTVIVYTQPIAIEEIRPGDFLGVTSRKHDDGTLAAFEVRRFPKPLNPGHRPFDGRNDQTMTNATVSATVQSTSGRELTLTYEGGSQKIVVPANAAISMLVPGERSQLTPGSIVNLNAAPGDDGRMTALRIQVSKDGVRPPQ